MLERAEHVKGDQAVILPLYPTLLMASDNRIGQIIQSIKCCFSP